MDRGGAKDGMRLARVRRGVKDAAQSAEFFGWLLDLAPEQVGEGFSLPCANGELLLHEDASTPVAIELSADAEVFRGRDTDGVPVLAAHDGLRARSETASVALDHVRLNCADLPAAIDFYRRLGLVLTWSGCGEDFLEGFHEEPIASADWVHLSGSDGYLSLSQADWQDYGMHSTASGPPRFVHIGFAVRDLAGIAARLDSAGISYLRSPRSPIGDRVYLNDPDGVSRLGTNVELSEYELGAPRSGRYEAS